MTNRDPNRAKNVSVIAWLAAVKRGLRKNPTSSIGWSLCSSQAANPPRTAKATASPPSVADEVQPLEGASMIDQTSAVSPTTDRTAPTGSSRGADGSFEFGTRNQPATSAVRTMG